jgi:drug/metabolite transporter (DMT)-like permease
MTKRQKGIIAMLVAVFVWGISFINIRIAMGVMGAMTLGGLRFLMATIILFVIMKVLKVDLTIHKKDIPLFVVAAGIGITVYFYFENNGVKYTSASIASIIIGAIPVFSVIAESIIYKKKITKILIASVLLSVVGVGMIVGLDLKDLKNGGSIIGYLMMFGAVISWIIYSIANKPLFKRYDQGVITFYQSLIGLIFFIPFIPFENNQWDQILTGNIFMHVFFLAAFASALGFYLYLKGLDYLGISESSIYINLIPVVTVILSYFWLGETLSPMQLLGGGLIIASVYIMNFETTVATLDA